MNYPPPNLWTKTELDIEPEPVMVEVTTSAWRHRLFVPATWATERREAFLEGWMTW